MAELNQNHYQRYSARINPYEKTEIEFWSKRFHVTGDVLKRAVEKVGTSEEAIAQFLKSQHLVRRY